MISGVDELTMIPLNSSQIEVLQDFISIGSTLQTEVARFFSAEARLEKKTSYFYGSLERLKKIFLTVGWVMFQDVLGILHRLSVV